MKIHAEWPKIVKKYTKYDGSYSLSEPVLSLRRNAFLHKNDEMRLRDSSIIELLYFEAKRNVLTGRYPREVSDCIVLGGLSAKISLENITPQLHNPSFFRYD